MNRFRKNKKGKDTVEDVDAVPSPVSMPNPFKKNSKKEEPEPKPEFDLENALPSTDQFRTSLLMPKLSARFSMLREQDDPTTKVGKANDDSVLFPKRASRLNLFGHNPSLLSDIEEVSSINGRPSLALGRSDSKRPTGEGNILFGGRQKVYKVPANASSSEGLRGRAVYEDDVTLSAFQRLRLKEREEKLAEETADSPQDSTSPDLEEGSPAFSTKRTTSSSTTSGNSNRRTSTAATSIDEQSSTGSQQASSTLGTSNNTPTSPNKPSWPPPNHVAKARRLYGQGIAQAVQDQQSSTLSRLESISRQRAGAGTPEVPRLNRSFSKSTTNLQERPSRISPVQAAPVYQGNSPPLSANSQKSNDAHHQDSTNGTAGSNPGYGSMPPLSPPMSETEEAATLAAALHPDDRGKATAMGLFNKPSTPFDEQQYSRRQLQMHEGRNTPPLRRRSPTNSVVQPDGVTRPRGLSNTSYRSKAESVSSRYSSEAHHNGPDSRASSVRDPSPTRATHNSFLMNLSGSDSEGDADDDGPAKQGPSASSQAPDGIHPAFRSRPGSRESNYSQQSAREVQDIPEVRYSDLSDLNTIAVNQATDGLPSPIPEEASDEKAPDSPTLGPSGLGLSGLIRTHLRHDSNVSSIYPPPSPRLPGQPDQQHPEPPSQEPHPPASSRSNESDDSMGQKPAAAEEHCDPAPAPAIQSAASSFSMRAKQLRDQAAALREQNESRAGSRAENHGQSWQDELKHMHKRDGSTETQKEREEFASVLAERRRRVEENLRNLGDIESRSSSPVPGRQTPDLSHGKPGNAFAMLKNRSVKHSPIGKQDSKQDPAQPKGLKMFGLGGSSTPMNASTPSLVSREEEPAHSLGKHSNSSAPHIASSHGISSRVRSSREETRESSSSRGPSPNSFGSRRRDRSNSASGRSKSRTRPRDDLGMVAEDAVSQYEGHQPEDHQHGPRGPPSVPASARPSLESNDRTSYERSAGRYRSNSRAAAPGYFDLDFIGESPRPSPVTPYAANTTPPLPETDTEPSRLSPSSTMLASLAQRSSGSNGLPKKTVDKSQISEPTFVSSTSNVPTVGLPPGASLSNGMEAPPVPPMNPRRRQTTTQTILNALKGDKSSASSGKDNAEERSTFEDDDDERRFLSRQRLRKTSGDHQRSEGGMI
ncbi:hypothetical protein T310_4738 [Rasamsonia emersonii CBS 393.64]|uniref:Uncharacterized protein n=1 Tax=Rasamsonia emersonii (strain ATCC 16479 / CBS 393.64 / IMI 116815) TaxID=1408163 RepID=A0A0F4YSI2_RASE3|nr:hypothetical protein T310_4738 [Rasamsonia emersonii CBS 393.64]KKA21232.1 hypothetical protein T310_4738 [Rasamsonia emersonii CBS 393.64]